ncbi:alanine racemase, partial [uncultured Senegalimassilia sp.]|uniref:alanine racemase n=1 Tax=uncultured Senegalimassilia sp. TaxID=1714350 RepID=UPI0025EB939C
FATADVPDDWDFALQLNRFRNTVAALHDAGLETGLVHCDNTPGTVLHPECQFDMCRVGVGLYGLQPAETTIGVIDLEPAMSVRGRVTRVVYPEVGAGVGYGMTYRVPKRNVQIATVPIGYADGLSRTLSNNMDVIVNGRRQRQVGNICMDQCMFEVDLRSYARRRRVDPQVGDEVLIVGQQGDAMVTIEEMCETLNTIPHELCIGFAQRMPRYYV